MTPHYETGRGDGNLITTAELARKLKVKPETVWRWVRLGRVPVVRIGQKTLRFDPAEVRAALRGEGVGQ